MGGQVRQSSVFLGRKEPFGQLQRFNGAIALQVNANLTVEGEGD